MKNIKLFIVTITFMANYSLLAQVAVNMDGSDPNPSAMLDVKSTSMGFMPPRVVDTNAISNPAEGLQVYDLSSHCLRYYNGMAWSVCIGTFTINQATPITVYNPTTGKYWIDRNLGASQVATSSIDAYAFGDLYQWGRAADGHEDRYSLTTSTNAATAVPNAGNSWDGLFITEDSYPFDWLTPQDNTLWQGESGTNNPCPSGFRLPTATELDAERLSWATNNAAGAYGSPLKLPVGGSRDLVDGGTYGADIGLYWSSTVSGVFVKQLVFGDGPGDPSDASVDDTFRPNGQSVRCIQD